MTGTGSSFGKDEDVLETARIEEAKAVQERQRIGYRRVVRHLRKQVEDDFGERPYHAEMERGIRKLPPDEWLPWEQEHIERMDAWRERTGKK